MNVNARAIEQYNTLRDVNKYSVEYLDFIGIYLQILNSKQPLYLRTIGRRLKFAKTMHDFIEVLNPRHKCLTITVIAAALPTRIRTKKNILKLSTLSYGELCEVLKVTLEDLDLQDTVNKILKVIHPRTGRKLRAFGGKTKNGTYLKVYHPVPVLFTVKDGDDLFSTKGYENRIAKSRALFRQHAGGIYADVQTNLDHLIVDASLPNTMQPIRDVNTLTTAMEMVDFNILVFSEIISIYYCKSVAATIVVHRDKSILIIPRATVHRNQSSMATIALMATAAFGDVPFRYYQ